jgi:hypothetical protein
MSLHQDPADFEDSLLDLLCADQPQTVVLASVHRPTFSQQLTVLHAQHPGFTETLPAPAQAFGRKNTLREILQ